MRWSAILISILTFMGLALINKVSKAQDSTLGIDYGDTIKSLLFGDVKMADLEMDVYPKDVAAPACILYQDGFVRYDLVKNKYSLEYHTQIKILNEEGLQYANVALPFLGRGGLDGVKAVTYNLVDGEIKSRVIANSETRLEELAEGIYVKSITFPEVVVGSIIEYTYKMYSSDPLAFSPWYFQTNIPVRFSRFRIWALKTKNLKPRLYGNHGLFRYDNGYFGPSHDLIMKNVPAFKEEPYVKKPDDHYAKVVFEYVSDIAKDWETMNELILGLKGFGETLSDLGSLKRAYPKNAGWGVNTESLKKIHSYVAGHFEWDGTYGLLFSDKPNKVWKLAKGHSADINLTLLMFLCKAGFTADPVFMSSISHGVINPDFPTFGQFNNLVVRVLLDGKALLVDATDQLRPYNILPEAYLNGDGLIIKPGEAEWVPMNTNNEREIQSVSADYEIDTQGKITGQGSIVLASASATKLRLSSTLAEETASQVESMEDLNEFEILNVSVEGLEDPYANIKTRFEFLVEDWVDVIEDQLFFSPIIIPELDANPFKEERRKLPMEFSMPINSRYFFNVTLPEGYEVEQIPTDVTYILPNGGGEYSYITKATPKSVQVLIRFRINRVMFGRFEYPDVKEMFSLIIDKQKETISLKRK